MCWLCSLGFSNTDMSLTNTKWTPDKTGQEMLGFCFEGNWTINRSNDFSFSRFLLQGPCHKTMIWNVACLLRIGEHWSKIITLVTKNYRFWSRASFSYFVGGCLICGAQDGWVGGWDLGHMKYCVCPHPPLQARALSCFPIVKTIRLFRHNIDVEA